MRIDEPTLFEMSAPSTPSAVNPRQSVIDSTHENANDLWKIRYKKFILTFATVATEPFTAEMVRIAYNNLEGVPKTQKQQGSGAIFQRLVKEGKLVRVGKIRSKLYGNDLTSYRKGDR